MPISGKASTLARVQHIELNLSAGAKGFMIRLVAAMLLALVGQSADAQGWQCASHSTVVTNLPTALAIPPGTAAGVALGAGPFTVTATLNNCSAPSFAGFSIIIGVGTALTPIAGVSGISYQLVGTPSTTTSGNCPSVVVQQQSNSVAATLVGSTAISNCTLKFIANGRYYLGTSRIVGTQSIPSVGPGFGYSQFQPSCNNVQGCGTYGGVGTGSTTGTFPIPVYVPACAGVLNGTQTVQLPKVSTSSFLNNTQPVAKTGFKISLAACIVKADNGEAGNVGYDAHVTWGFTEGAASNVIASTGSSSVGVQILRRDMTTAVDKTQDDVHTLVNGTNDLQYYAAYVNPGGGAVTPGTVKATATLTVTYQ